MTHAIVRIELNCWKNGIGKNSNTVAQQLVLISKKERLVDH